MWENILQIAAESGIWAVLFVVLFCKQIKESKTREENYQSTIDNLAEKLKIIAEIKSDVTDIRSALNGQGFLKAKSGGEKTEKTD